MRCQLGKIGILMFGLFVMTGCANNMSNQGQMEMYLTPNQEAEWIQNGEPIEFDGKLWYPQDKTENLLDAEVSFLGEYRDVQFFVEKLDVQPYHRLYTKFSRHRFRYFELRKDDE